MVWTLRRKILIGYTIFLTLTVVVFVLALSHLFHLGRASEAILSENYKSILAAENMIDAIEHVKRVISLDPARAEAFNLLGALLEIRGDRLNALKNYRAALSLDPTYEPATKNLDRTASRPHHGSVVLGEVRKPEMKKK